MSNPIFGAHSRLDLDTITATPVENPAFPRVNLKDDRLYTVFKPNAAATIVDLVTDALVPVPVDYFMAVAHDFFNPASDGLGPLTVTFASSPDNIVYTTIFTVLVADNKIIARAFAAVTERYFRLRLTRGVAFIPTIGELQWGVRVEVPFGVMVGFDPQSESINANVQRSQTGQFLGAVRTFSSRQAELKFPLLTDAFVRSAVAPGGFQDFWDNHACKMKPFLFAWSPGNPGAFEKDSFFALVDPAQDIVRPLRTQLASGYRDLEFSVMGVKE
jgi:hypothetical protein